MPSPSRMECRPLRSTLFLLAASAVSLAGQIAMGQESTATESVNSLQLNETEATITVTQGGSTVLVYNKQPAALPGGMDAAYRRSGFLHPVAAPAARVVTATYPLDHPAAFLNDQRSDRVRGNHEHAKWVALSGTIDGQPACIAVLSHAENFRAPQAARLHPTKPYFSFSPCVDGECTIDKDHPWRARYRYLITDAPPDPTWLDQQWQ